MTQRCSLYSGGEFTYSFTPRLGLSNLTTSSEQALSSGIQRYEQRFIYNDVGSWDVGIATLIAVLVTTSIAFTYLTTWLSFRAQQSRTEAAKLPPIAPYIFPFLGSALSFAVSPARCVASTRKAVGTQAVFGLKLLNHTLYFLNGSEHVARIWKYKGTITTPGVQTFCLVRVFGMAKDAVNMYILDNSGIQAKACPRSSVEPRNRIDYLTHMGFHKLLTGVGLSNLYRRWLTSFIRRVEDLGIADTWVLSPDIVDFWMPPLTASLNEAIAGPLPECINPHFTKEVLEFLPFVHSLMKGVPRWFIPRAYHLRRTLVQNVRQWHAIARAQFKDSDIHKDGDLDPWWGSACIRERQKMLSAIDNWDHESIASSDFGLLWGANINVHTAAIWTIIEIFKDQNLLIRVRKELDAISYTPDHEIDEVLSLPLLQSVYAEVLRLRVEVQSVFYNEDHDISINELRFPKKNLLLVPVGPAHRDASFWNTKDGKHPLHEFWADRFLIYPNDPQSGPRRKYGGTLKNLDRGLSQTTADLGEPKFVSTGLTDSFMPYGIGERACPGQFFARREIVSFCAQLVQGFDVEILSTEKHFKSSSLFYGLGTQQPLGKIPFRIRKRHFT